jgi:anti-anti-sigma factor
MASRVARDAHDTGVPGEVDTAGTLTVQRSDDAGGSVTVVRLEGEHDLATVATVEEAFANAPAADALVADLSSCAFIDSSIIRALVRVHQSRARFAVALSTDASAPIPRILEITQLRHVLNCFESIEAAQAGALVGDESRAPRTR